MGRLYFYLAVADTFAQVAAVVFVLLVGAVITSGTALVLVTRCNRRRRPRVRAKLVDVFIAHQRVDAGRCLCGWDDWGGSHAEHVADQVPLFELQP